MGVTEKGVSHLVASALCLGIAGPATVVSHKCDVPLLVKARPKCGRQSLASTNALKTHTPQIRGAKIHPPNLGGESSKSTCFTVFYGAYSLNSGGEIFNPQIWGVWVFRVVLSSRSARKCCYPVFAYTLFNKPAYEQGGLRIPFGHVERICAHCLIAFTATVWSIVTDSYKLGRWMFLARKRQPRQVPRVARPKDSENPLQNYCPVHNNVQPNSITIATKELHTYKNS